MGWEKRRVDPWITNTDETHQSRCNAHCVWNVGAAWPKHVGLEVSKACGRRTAKEGLLASVSVALQSAGCEFNLELVLFQMPAQST